MTRHRLPTVVVVVVSAVAAAAAVSGAVAFFAADLAPATRARFSAASAGPTCTISSHDVELRYPIGRSTVPYSIYNAPRVHLALLSGLEYVAVDTDPSSPPDRQPSPRDPQYRRLKVADGSTVVISLRLEGRVGSADGLQFDWADGEPTYTQTLPLTLSVTTAGCTVQ